MRPSLRTHGYYRKALLPLMREAMGCITDAEAHRQIKAGFFGMHPDDPALPSMADMPQEEANRLIDYAIVEAAQVGVILPDPERKRCASPRT